MWKLIYLAYGEIENTFTGTLEACIEYAAKQYSYDEDSAQVIRDDLGVVGSRYCDVATGAVLVIVSLED